MQVTEHIAALRAEGSLLARAARARRAGRPGPCLSRLAVHARPSPGHHGDGGETGGHADSGGPDGDKTAPGWPAA